MPTVLFLILGIGVVILAGVLGSKRRQTLVNEGKIIEREYDFHEKTYLFLTSKSYQDIINAVNVTDFSDADVQILNASNNKNSLLFKHNNSWVAKLEYKGQRDGKNMFSYGLTSWKTNRGVPAGGHTMNMMQTALEKMFLSLDPETMIETHKMQIKTQ